MAPLRPTDPLHKCPVVYTTGGRFARWAKARRLVGAIVAHLRAGGSVMVCTYTKATRYDGPAHADSFRAQPSGAYVRRGRDTWLCIDYCGIRFSVSP